MSDLPKSIFIQEEGPREGFQYEKTLVPTVRKIELINRLARTGLKHIQVVSFVNPKAVPGMADAEEVVQGIDAVPGVHYSALWLNDKGLHRAIALKNLHVIGSIALTASEVFLKRNQNRSFAQNLEAQRRTVDLYKELGVPVTRGTIMAAFGCNFEGDIPLQRILDLAAQILDMAAENDLKLEVLNLSDTMGWATPGAITKVVGAVREKYPQLDLSLHLHDTRGMGIANAFAGLQLGVRRFDASVGGLGGCPFAGNAGAAGNVCTEDLVFMCDEMGIETGVDLDALIECARLAEDIVGHPLPGSLMRGGSLKAFRRRDAATI
jgi:hydroxymethylglutaryl-CoA lyase